MFYVSVPYKYFVIEDQKTLETAIHAFKELNSNDLSFDELKAEISEMFCQKHVLNAIVLVVNLNHELQAKLDYCITTDDEGLVTVNVYEQLYVEKCNYEIKTVARLANQAIAGRLFRLNSDDIKLNITTVEEI